MPIVIDGNIGSGKTTALKNLRAHPWIKENMFSVVEENVDEWKPYLAEFYKDMKKNALLFQMKVLQHHMKQSKQGSGNVNSPTVSPINIPMKITERSPLSCLHVFGENLHQNGMLSDLDMQLMLDMNRDFGWMPRVVFYIYTPADICYERIHIRSRENEIIPMAYLEQIDELYRGLYLDDDNVHPYRPKECYIIDGRNPPEEVVAQIVTMMKSHFGYMNRMNRMSFNTHNIHNIHNSSSLSHARSYPTLSSMTQSNRDESASPSSTSSYSSTPRITYHMSAENYNHGNFGYQ
jgi:deoxyadenosine/deoxycytidine kinase